MQAVLKRNYGFSTFTSVCQVPNGDNVDPPEHTAPEKIPLLKYAPVISCEEERSFSTYKHILSVYTQLLQSLMQLIVHQFLH
jgi:hypothetical protein